jgi:hypothetical protein
MKLTENLNHIQSAARVPHEAPLIPHYGATDTFKEHLCITRYFQIRYDKNLSQT